MWCATTSSTVPRRVEDVLAMAPDAEDGRFAVPRIMGEAP